MNTIGYFEIQASNPEKANTFYQNVFGWKFFKGNTFGIFQIDETAK